MDLYFSRRRFLETSFYCPSTFTLTDGTHALDEIYRVSTTVKRCSILPDVTTIEYVGGLDEEKHHVVATIEWNWPSVDKSFITMDGWKSTLKLSEFLVKEKGLKSGMKLFLGEDMLCWKTPVCKPTTLVDANNRPLALLDHRPHGLRPVCRALSVEPGCLKLDATLLADKDLRDSVIASFVAMRASRDVRLVCTPWWREGEADFEGIRLKVLI